MLRMPVLQNLRYFVLSVLLLCSSLHALEEPEQQDTLTVVATFSILADFVAAVGGEYIALHVLVGPDSDGHLYQPTPADSRLLRGADLVVMNGLGFEGWMERLIRASEYQGEVLVASAGITPLQVVSGSVAEADPHAWHDVGNVRRYVQNISLALQEQLPGAARYFKDREQRYLAELDQLDDELRSSFAMLPAGQRSVVTSHDAFGYFAAAYGLRFLAPLGLNTDSEASAGNVARLIRQIRAENIRAVFVENISDPRLLQRITSESGARIGGTLYSDALSPPEGPAPNYLALMRHNLRKLMEALAVPPTRLTH
jgi:zinc/manganese transport system substrate-binding protein